MNQSPPVSAPLQSCGLATWSLVLGIAAIVLCVVCVGPLLGIPAVICGHIALGRIKRANGTMKGHGPAIGGLVTGYISIALIPVIGLLSAIAIPNFVKARQTAQMKMCISNLRLIDSAKQQWALEKGKDAAATPTQDDIAPYLGRNQVMPVCPAGGTYDIKPANEAPTCTIPDHVLTH
jgi:competence protein ComGC